MRESVGAEHLDEVAQKGTGGVPQKDADRPKNVTPQKTRECRRWQLAHTNYLSGTLRGHRPTAATTGDAGLSRDAHDVSMHPARDPAKR